MKTTLLVSWPVFIIASILAAGQQAEACTCAHDTVPFIEAAEAAPLVVRGLVKNHHGHWGVFTGKKKYLDLEVTEVMKGRFEPRFLLIVGGSGADCRHNVTKFRVGSEWVFVLNLAPESSARRPAFEVSRCSEGALGVVNGGVGGLLTRNPGEHLQSLSLPELRSLLQTRVTGSGV